MSHLPPLVDPVAELTLDEVRRYSRHLIIDEVGMLGQRRLKTAKVLVIGAGGLGSPALLYLAAAGVGTLGVIDDDVVEESNLHRQVVHGQSDIGRTKISSAADTVAEVNPYVNFVGHTERLDTSNAVELFGRYDLVLDGTDNFATRYLVNDAAVLAQIPYVWGSILRFSGQVSVFWAEHGPQYRDLYPEAPPPGLVPSCAEGGVLGVLCASIGSIMVTEAIKLITGIGNPLLGRLLIHDALEMTYRTLELKPDPEQKLITELDEYEALCGLQGAAGVDAADGASIGVEELAAWLAERDRGERAFTLVDVREAGEREINTIPGAVHVPKGDFLDGTALATLPPGLLVLHCRSGARSADCLAVLHGAGRDDAVHVDGGVNAWVERIDPSQPLY
ncbi:MAG: molybdopterin-synthase adenylyltransferase MoeB [Propionibacteriales bacterium]|nr:molybdopterin-synthase adenylyltransferase MoeB [Propionibacteriales bacterium]